MGKILLAGTAMAVATVPGIALAQNAIGQPPVAAGNAVPSQQASGIPDGSATTDATAQTQASVGLQDIVVTAQRRSESSQKAAIAISVVGGAAITGAGITQPERLNQLVPALTISNVGPSATSFIRGVGNFSVAVTSDPAVAFNYDGVYLGRLTATSTTFFDLDRVEVLKGPQGTLYGRNATAGAINVLPTQPKLGEFTGYATGSYGNYNAAAFEGAINAPLGDNGAIRISGVYNHRDGYESDGTSDDKSQGVRVQMKAKLAPNLTARLAFDYSHLGGVGQGASYLNTYNCSAATPSTPGVTPHCVVTPTNIPRSDGLLSPASQAFFTNITRPGGAAITGRAFNPFPALFQNSNFYGTNADVEWDTGSGVLTVIPAIRFDHVQNRNAGGGFPILNNQNDIQYSLETRFAGKVSLFDYTVGMFYYNEDANLRASTLTGSSNLNLQVPTDVKTESYAPFLRVTAHLTDRLRLVGGIRYTHDDKSFYAHGITIRETCNPGAVCPTAILPTDTFLNQLPFAYPTNQSPSAAVATTVPGPTPNTTIARTDIFFNNQLTNHRVTYRGAAEFDLAPASLLYASIETGYRSGGFNNAVGLETYQPEYLTAYTIGSKNRFFNNRVQLNLEGFYWRYRNEQIAHAAVDQLLRPGSYTQNIGRSTIKGVEAETRVLVTPTTELTADVQYLDSVQKSYTYTTVGYPYTTCGVTPAGVAGFFPLFSVNCAGKPGYNAPKWSLNLGGQQTVPLGDYKVVFGVDTQFKTKRYTYFDYALEQLQGKSWTTNAQIAFGPQNGRWSLQGFVRNIENRRLLTSPVAFGNILTSFTSPPRTFGGRLSVKF